MSKMTGVREIEADAFNGCTALSDVYFDKPEIIGFQAFGCCDSLRSTNMLSVMRVGSSAFWWCTTLMEAVFSEALELFLKSQQSGGSKFTKTKMENTKGL